MSVNPEVIEALGIARKLRTDQLVESGHTNFKPMYLRDLDIDWKTLVDGLRLLFQKGYHRELITSTLEFFGMDGKNDKVLNELIDGAYVFSKLKPENSQVSLTPDQFRQLLDELLTMDINPLLVMEIMDAVPLSFMRAFQYYRVLAERLKSQTDPQ